MKGELVGGLDIVKVSSEFIWYPEDGNVGVFENYPFTLKGNCGASLSAFLPGLLSGHL